MSLCTHTACIHTRTQACSYTRGNTCTLIHTNTHSGTQTQEETHTQMLTGPLLPSHGPRSLPFTLDFPALKPSLLPSDSTCNLPDKGPRCSCQSTKQCLLLSLSGSNDQTLTPSCRTRLQLTNQGLKETFPHHSLRLASASGRSEVTF